jgi:phenylacetate-CoA ligase
VRGVNVFPSSIDSILRQFESIREYRINVHRQGSLDELSIDAEVSSNLIPKIEETLTVQLGLRIPVRAVLAGSIPVSEGKARRVVRTSS